MSAVINVAALADSIADTLRSFDATLRRAAKKNPYLVVGAATVAGLALVGGLLPAAARALPLVTKVATSRFGSRVLTALAGAALAKRLGDD